MTQPPHVAASKRRQRRSWRRSRSQLRRRHHRIALIDCVYATQLLHSLCFGGFGFSFSFSLFVSFSFCFRFLGRAILRCHMLHATCHTPHSTKTSAVVRAQDQCCLCFGQVNRFLLWQWAKTKDLGNELEIDFDTICHCN